MDILGPLLKSSRDHQYILVLMDYATRYLEAIPLCTATGKTFELLYGRRPQGLLDLTNAGMPGSIHHGPMDGPHIANGEGAHGMHTGGTGPSV